MGGIAATAGGRLWSAFMYDWILEADIHRYQHALTETTDRMMRDRLTRLLGLTRQRLFEANIAAAHERHRLQHQAPASAACRDED